MRMSWKLGRFAGIDVFLHPTFLLILLLPGVFSDGLFSLAVVIAAFGCVLLHEFGHALTARRFGIDTEDITLYPIGGVARLKRMPRSPGAELTIALAGPAVNVAIAALLLVLGYSGVTSLSPSLAWFSLNLVVINVILALFNLIPAFPMDGGRVLRALLSGWLGRVKATAVAAGLGRVLAVLFGLFSLWQGNFMQVALAFFIYHAASMELAQVVADEQRRRSSAFDGVEGQEVWTAPPGYRWVSRGRGVWQLAPVVVRVDDRFPPQWS